MITNSITHVLQSVLQYIALIAALLLYRWIKDVFPLSDVPYIAKRFDRYRYILKNHRTRSWIRDESSILYQWIKQLRLKNNLTQEELAEIFGVDPRTVQRWENGETRPQPRHYGMFQQLEQDWRNDNLIIPLPPKSVQSRISFRLFPLFLLCLTILLALLVFLLLHFWFHLI
jgi:transcriptional regulator with XRE-family HTH domain